MMNLMSNDEGDKLKLNSNEVDKKKNAWGKTKNYYSEEEVDWYKICKIYHQKVYTFWHCVVNDEVPSASSQIVEQIEVIGGVVLPWISKMNDSEPEKKPKEQIQFSPREALLKGKWFWFCIIFAIPPFDGLCYRVISSSILQDFFHLS